MAINIIVTVKPVEREYQLLDTDVALLLDIRNKVGLVPAIKVARLMMKDIGLKEVMDFVKALD